ncbi:hypothetical protein [Alicyclobacillus fodiniaquatilis]|uniref:Uncharacterized protein n=1 Tax=Alicyclobacillus fodiniaquatilis TaxID=1661150 RepID=A0ABW4JH43_9BACL
MLITLKGVRHYFCGLGRAGNDDWNLIEENGAKFILLSYWDLRRDKTDSWRQKLIDHGLSVLIDSGEFSRFQAERDGIPYEPLLVEDYAAWLWKHQDLIVGALSLDKIGDAETSERNYRYLVDQGLQPIPVWHCQSSWESLEAMVRQDHPIIAIGGTKFIKRAERHQMFSELFRRYPTQPFHGLGVASPYIAMYDWFSVDSSSWLAGRQFGRLVTPFRQYVSPDDWTSEEALAFNIRQLASMEDNYEGIYQVDLLAQPGTRHKGAGRAKKREKDNQLSLFDLMDLVG